MNRNTITTQAFPSMFAFYETPPSNTILTPCNDRDHGVFSLGWGFISLSHVQKWLGQRPEHGKHRPRLFLEHHFHDVDALPHPHRPGKLFLLRNSQGAQKRGANDAATTAQIGLITAVSFATRFGHPRRRSMQILCGVTWASTSRPDKNTHRLT